ncbi:MAG: hypothetical protein ACK6C0_16970 [Betaproteobacteria bacterium]
MKAPIVKFASLRLLPLCCAVLLAACSGSGGSESPPTDVVAEAEDGRVVVKWNAVGGTTYWVFSASNSTLTTTNWLNFLDGRAIVNATMPNYVCGLSNLTRYYFTLNARTGDAGGGPGSPLVNAVPRSAGENWTAAAALGADFAAVGFSPLTTCLANQAPTGTFVVVGPRAKVFSTTGAKPGAWAAGSVPAGFTADLFGVAGRTASLNNTSAPGLLFVAVGAGSATLTSSNGGTWTAGAAFDAAKPTLRAVAYLNPFFAVGDGGTIQTSSDGVTWFAKTSNTTANLRALALGNGRYIAVGDGGTVVASTNTNDWIAQRFDGVGNLVGVVYGNRSGINTFVAIGDSGATLVSTDGGVNWSVRKVADGVAPRAIAYTTTFAVVTADGSVYRSLLGLDWLGPVSSGTTGLSALTQDGYGFIAVGAGGANTTSY